MGKGLSPLQKDILALLEEIPAFEEQPNGIISGWATPRQMLAALDRPPTPSNRAALSKALLRLYERGLVARASSELASVGKSFRYVRIGDPKNARVGNSGPKMVIGHRPRLRHVGP
jgi:hypothetical protein